MVELLILLPLALLFRSWLQVPTAQDCEDWIVMNEFDWEGQDSA